MAQNVGPRSIEAIVEGDISGQVAVGDYNLQIGSIHGGIVHIVPAAKQCAPRPRATPIDLRPRRFPGLLDRAEEVRVAQDALAKGGPVELRGQDGIGKTSILRHLAHEFELARYPDGIVYLSTGRQPIGDLLQSLYDAFYECDVPYIPPQTQLRLDLQNTRSLILLDDAELQREDTQALLDFLQQCTVVASARQRIFWGEGRSVSLAGLPTADALALLERELGASLNEAQRDQAERLCEALSGHPLRIIQLAAVVRDQDRSLSEIAQEVASLEAFDELVVEGAQQLPESEREVLGLLAALGGPPLHSDHVAAITGISHAADVLQRLRKNGLIRSHSPRYSLQDNLAEALRARWGTSRWVDRGLSYFEERTPHTSPEGLLEDAEIIQALLHEAAATRRWQTVIILGRGLDTALALGKRWDSWEEVLNSCRQVAAETKDASTEAWALHQLGTRSLCLKEAARAKLSLTQALQIRQQLGDEEGAAVTRHNLDLLLGPPGDGGDDSDGPPPDTGPSPPKTPSGSSLNLGKPLLYTAMTVTGIGILTAILYVTGVIGLPAIPEDEQVEVKALHVIPNTLMGGEMAEATVTLNRPAPDMGFDVDVRIDKPQAAFFAGKGQRHTLRVRPGEIRASVKLGTSESEESQDVWLTASRNGEKTVKGRLNVTPTVKLSSLEVTPPSVPGGQGATGKLTLNRPAPRDDFDVTVSLNDSQAASLAAGPKVKGRITLGLKRGETEASFQIITNPSGAHRQVTVTAMRGSQRVLTEKLLIQPTVKVASLELDPRTVSGGDAVRGTVMLNGPAPQGGVQVNLEVEGSGAAILKPGGQSDTAMTLPISQASLRSEFTLTTSPTDVLKTVRVVVRQNTELLERTITIRPAIKLAQVDVSPQAVIGGRSAAGTATLNHPAEEEVAVRLEAEPPVVRFLIDGRETDRVAIPAGKRAGNFRLETTAVQKQTRVTVIGRYKDGAPKQDSITLSVGVPVPNVTDLLMPKAKEVLEASTLRPRYPKRAFKQDRVRSQNPPAHRTDRPSIVAEGQIVELELKRPVPNVTKLTLEEARSKLQRWDLTAKYPADASKDDVVAKQSPTAGSFVSPKGNVQLVLKVSVPKVAGRWVEEALEVLSERGLRNELEPKIQPNELQGVRKQFYVGSQAPKAGQLVDPGTAVKLRLAVKVPNLIDQTVKQASSLLERRYLESRVVNRLAMPSDVVRGQSPNSGKAVFLTSPVTVDPVMAPIPDVTGLSVGGAVAKLEEERFQPRLLTDSVPSAKVTGQDPRPGGHKPRGTAVTLVIKVQVPLVTRLAVREAWGRLRAAGLGATNSHRPLRSDLVYNQVPPALAWTDPGTPVKLGLGAMVPRLIGQTPERAAHLLESVGLAPGIVRTRETEVADPRQHGRRTIVGQRPLQATLVPRGRPVEVEVEHLVATVPTPGLIGDTLPLALKKLASSRLQYRPGGPQRQITTPNPRLNGVVRVYNQVPPLGARVRMGSAVRLWTQRYNYVRREEEPTPRRPYNEVPEILRRMPLPIQPGGTRLR